eukprot:SAG31_NODE_1065_length_10096_cov_7.151530_6_plen_86_part_00
MQALSRLVPHLSRLKSRVSRIVVQKRESNPLPSLIQDRSEVVAKVDPDADTVRKVIVEPDNAIGNNIIMSQRNVPCRALRQLNAL